MRKLFFRLLTVAALFGAWLLPEEAKAAPSGIAAPVPQQTVVVSGTVVDSSGEPVLGAILNFFTGERLEGGRWYYDVKVPLDEMPVFVRPGSLIKLYPDDVDSTDDMDMNKAVTLEITKDFKGLDI